MTDDDWIGVDETGRLAAFSSEGMRPKRDDALTGRSLRPTVIDAFADAMARAAARETLPAGGQFLPCVCVAKTRAPFDDPDVAAPVRAVDDMFVAVLDVNFPQDRADALMMKPDVLVFDYDDKSLRAVGAIAGLFAYDPLREAPVSYVRYAARADKTLRPYQQAVLAAHQGGTGPAIVIGDIPGALADRLTPVKARFAESDKIDVARSADVMGGVLTFVTPTGLTDTAAAPRWPMLLLLVGAGIIALLYFFL